MSLSEERSINSPSDNMGKLLLMTCRKATQSPDPSTQNGAMLAFSEGQAIPETLECNRFPLGVQYRDERWERPAKYGWIEHAERNAIYAAARHGIRTYGLTLVSPWAACSDCARAIIEAGIDRLVTLSPTANTNDRWMDSISQAMTMLAEAGVQVVHYDKPLQSAPPLRRDGEMLQL